MDDPAITAVLSSPMLAAAVESARHGFPIYPARPRAKAPLFKGWQRAATTKVDYLVEGWQRHPSANVGVACRDLMVLDADSRAGEDAVAELDLPPTTSVRTRRGSHRYFLGNAPTVPNLLPDVELRGKGSGVLGPGSVHPTGFEYEWEIPPWEVPPAVMPAELQALVDAKGRRRGERAIGPVFPGGRSTYLLRVGAGLRGRHGVGDVADVLKAVNEVQCNPPLPSAKVEKIAAYVSGSVGHPPMWAIDPTAFCCTDDRLTPAARLLLHVICRHADEDGKAALGYRRLGKLAGVGIKKVGEVVRELEAKERLEVRWGRRRNETNRYKVLSWSWPDESLFTLPSPQGGLTSVSTGKHQAGQPPRIPSDPHQVREGRPA
jgi:hypothetical protein